MKPWVVRVFDPRPPWWRSNGLLTLCIAILIACALFVFASYHWRGGTGGRGGAPLYISTTDEAIPYSDWDQHQVTHIVKHPARVQYSENDHQKTILIDFLPITYHENAWPEKLIDGPMSHQAFSEKYPQWAEAFERNLRETITTPDIGDPPWVREAILYAIANKASYHKTTYTSRFYAWVSSWVALSLLVVLLIGGFWVRSNINTRRAKMRAGICSGCGYDVDHEEFAICPECGLDLEREIQLLVLMHTDGYRGLKRFHKLEKQEPA